jgi:hypothetical protein
MSNPSPSRVCRQAARLLRVGDEISVPIQSDGMRSIGNVAMITALEDDEPNRRIRVTAHIHKTEETKTFEVKPGDTFDRLAHADDLRQTVMVLASEFWKWIGTHFNDPKTGRARAVRMRVWASSSARA